MAPPKGPVRQHRSLSERCAAARAFCAAGWPTDEVLDSLADDALRAFGGWPLRLYVLHRGRVCYKAQPCGRGASGYDLADLREALRRIAHSAHTRPPTPGA